MSFPRVPQTQFFDFDGDPNGVIAGPPSQVLKDPSTGDLWIKQSEKESKYGWTRLTGTVEISSFIGEDGQISDAAGAAAVAAVPEGGTLFFRSGTTRLSSELVINKSITIDAEEGAILKQTRTNNSGIRVTASDVTIRNLRISGPQFAVNPLNEYGINLAGASANAPVVGIKIQNCHIDNWGTDGIHADWVNDLDISGNTIKDIYYAGIQLLSCQRGTIARNNISNIVGTPNAYGIALNRANSSSLITHPRTSDFTVMGNLIKDVPVWEGIDTHGGQRITIIGNTIRNAFHGIAVTRAPNASDVETFASLEVSVIGNSLDSTKTDGSAGQGIYFVGCQNAQKSTGVVVGNTIRGYGAVSSNTGCAIFTRDTEGLVISGNHIVEPSRYGILSEQNDTNINITGNTIIDPWSTTSEAVGIRFRTTSGNSTGFVSGNRMGIASKSSTFVLTYGIRVATGNTVFMGVNSVVGAATGAIFTDGTPNLTYAGQYAINANSLAINEAMTLSEFDFTVEANTNAAGFTVTLPTFATTLLGRIFNIKKMTSDGNTLTLSGGGTNIDGTATKTNTTQYFNWQVQRGQTQWILL